MSDVHVTTSDVGTEYVRDAEVESLKLKLASAEADFKQAATNAETNARLHDDALRRLLSAEAKLADALADAASWQQQADARLNDAVEFGRRAEKAEARVKELESLVILNTGYCEGALLVRIPTTERARIEAKTLGEAMPRKEP